MNKDINRQLLDFIAASPTAFHAAENVAAALREAGFTELYESGEWKIAAPGDYFVRRNGSSLLAFRLPEDFSGFMIMAAHGDSPCFKIREGAEPKAAGAYRQLSVEKYGGMLCSTWMDRPLSAAGRLMIREGDGISQRLVNIDRDLLLIPSLAIHMDRSANEGRRFDPAVDMQPLFGAAEGARRFLALAAESVGAAPEGLLSGDLFLYCRAPGTLWGAEEEYLSAPRLDDLQCVFACLKGFLAAEKSQSARVLCVFDNEEVGSGTKQGADSGFLADTLERLWQALGRGREPFLRALAGSFMVSADNAHALHPNHPECADRGDRPLINGGVVIKYNANQKYTTDAVSAAVFGEICRRAGVPVQRYANRPDIPGGSTLGNISCAHVAIDCVDVGLAQLAMHSAYETAGARDTAYLCRAAEAFYASAIRRDGEKIRLETEK